MNMDIEKKFDDLIQRIREAQRTGMLKLAEGDGHLIGAALELYTALFELKGDFDTNKTENKGA